jgi:hypothetical protein
MDGVTVTPLTGCSSRCSWQRDVVTLLVAALIAPQPAVMTLVNVSEIVVSDGGYPHLTRRIARRRILARRVPADGGVGVWTMKKVGRWSGSPAQHTVLGVSVRLLQHSIGGYERMFSDCGPVLGALRRRTPRGRSSRAC